MAIRFLINHYLFRFLVARHASPFTGIPHTVAHLPLLALELLLNLDHHLCAEPCAVTLNALVLTTGATLLNLAAVSVSDARNSDFLCHCFNFFARLCRFYKGVSRLKEFFNFLILIRFLIF